MHIFKKGNCTCYFSIMLEHKKYLSLYQPLHKLIEIQCQLSAVCLLDGIIKVKKNMF